MPTRQNLNSAKLSNLIYYLDKIYLKLPRKLEQKPYKPFRRAKTSGKKMVIP